MVAFGMQFPVAPMPCARAAEKTKTASRCPCDCGTKCNCCCSKKAPSPEKTPKPKTPKGCSCEKDKTPPASPTPVVVEQVRSATVVPVLVHTFQAAESSGCDVVHPTAHGPPSALPILKTIIILV